MKTVTSLKWKTVKEINGDCPKGQSPGGKKKNLKVSVDIF